MLECGEDWGAGEGLAVQNMGGSVVHWQVGMLLVVIPPPTKKEHTYTSFFFTHLSKSISLLCPLCLSICLLLLSLSFLLSHSVSLTVALLFKSHYANDAAISPLCSLTFCISYIDPPPFTTNNCTDTPLSARGGRGT